MNKITILFSIIFLGGVTGALILKDTSSENKIDKTVQTSVQSKAAESDHNHTEYFSGIDKNCIRCHGPEKQKGKVRLDSLANAPLDFNKIKLIEKSIELISKGEMPPKKKDALTSKEKELIISSLNKYLADNESVIKEQNRTTLRRLNNQEYLYTVSDIFGFDPKDYDPTTNFPADQRYEGVNKIGSELIASKFLTRDYLQAATEIVDKMVRFDNVMKPKTYKMDSKKLNTRLNYDNYAVLCTSAYSGGGLAGQILLKDFAAPEDGYYDIKIQARAVNRVHDLPKDIIYIDQQEPIRLALKTGVHTDMNIKAVFDLKDDIEDWYTCRIWLNKGESPQIIYPNSIYSMNSLRHTLPKIPDLDKRLGIPKEVLTSAIKLRNQPPKNYVYQHALEIIPKLKMPKMMVKQVDVKGPVYEEWTPAHNPLVIGSEQLTSDNWKNILISFGTKLFRAPQSPVTMQSFLNFTEEQLSNNIPLNEAFKNSIKAMLCAPEFLFMKENSADLSQHELATRLSYFLWSSSPDSELLTAAQNNQLKHEGLSAQVERMLKDKKSERFVNNFTSSWLKLYDLGGILPHDKLMKEYYYLNLQESLKKETQLFVRYILQNNLDIADFINSDYSIIDRRLATLYKLDFDESSAEAFGYNQYNGKAPSTAFIKYNFKDSRRGGLLGQASTMMVSANGIDTSPVVRGVWVLEHLLCRTPPPPPEQVPAIEPDTRGAKSIRDRLKKHQADENCASCHKKMDPLGYALENYDAIGRWRHNYQRNKIDPSGELNGRKFEDISGLKEILVESKDEFANAFSEKLLSYAIGRKLTFLDETKLIEIQSSFKQNKYRFKELIRLICTSELFLKK